VFVKHQTSQYSPSPEMASSSTPKKHTTRACVKNVEPSESTETDYLERWFVGNHKACKNSIEITAEK